MQTKEMSCSNNSSSKPTPLIKLFDHDFIFKCTVFNSPSASKEEARVKAPHACGQSLARASRRWTAERRIGRAHD
jgi:hypothetical protein